MGRRQVSGGRGGVAAPRRVGRGGARLGRTRMNIEWRRWRRWSRPLGKTKLSQQITWRPGEQDWSKKLQLGRSMFGVVPWTMPVQVVADRLHQTFVSGVDVYASVRYGDTDCIHFTVQT